MGIDRNHQVCALGMLGSSMKASFTGLLQTDPQVKVTFVWEDGVFSAPDPVSKAHLPYFMETAKRLESEWAIAPGLPVEPPGDHTQTPAGVWFLVLSFMLQVSATGDSDPNGVPTPPRRVV